MRIKSSRGIIIGGLITALLIVLGFWFQQMGRYAKESARLQKRTDKIAYDLKKAKTILRNFERFKKEQAEIENQWSEMLKILPADLEIESFLDRFSALAEQCRVARHDLHVETMHYEFYTQAELGMTLQGALEDVNALVRRLSQGPRLVVAKIFQGAKNQVPANFYIYSLRGFKTAKPKKRLPDEKTCARFESKVWLWPYAARIQEGLERLERACTEREEFADGLKMFEAHQAKAKKLKMGIEIIQALEKKKSDQDTGL